MTESKTKRILKVFWKIIKTILLILAGLILILVIGLQLPFVRDKIVDIALEKVRQKVDTKVELASLNILLPNSVHLEGLYVEDKSNDTLIYAGEIEVQIGITELIGGDIDISKFSLENATAKINRPEGDSLFNFHFIVEAFAGPEEEKKEKPKEKNGSSVSFGRIELDDIRFVFDDNYTGNYVEAGIGDFITVFSESDLQEMLFEINRLGLQNSYAIMELQPSEDTTESQNELNIALNRTARLKNVNFSMKVPGSELDVNNVHLKINPEDVKTGEQKIHLNRILLSNTEISFHKTAETEAASEKTEESGGKGSISFPWDINIAELDMHSNRVEYVDETASGADTSSMFKNLHLYEIRADINDIKINSETYQADIESFDLYEPGGITLEKLSAEIEIYDSLARLNDFNLITSNSAIHNTTVAHYSSFDQLSENPGEIKFTTDFGRSRISTDDIAYIVPALGSKLETAAGRDRLYVLSGYIHGKVEDMDIESLKVRNNQDLILDLQGRIRGLPDAKTAWYRIDLDTLDVRKYHIYSFVPDTTIPPSIDIPEEIHVAGNFEGYIDDFTTDVRFYSSQGNLSSNLSFESENAFEQYSGNIEIDNYDIGELLKNEENLGEIKLHGEFRGTSRDFKNIDASFRIDIAKAVANKYEYNNIDISGNYEDKLFNGEISINDSNLVADFTGQASLGDSVPEYDFDLFVEGADLMALNLTDEDIRLRGTIISDFRGNNLNEINGSLKAQDFIVIKNDETYRLDSLVAEADNTEGRFILNVNSPILEAKYEGSVAVNELGILLRENFNHYFNLKEKGGHEHTAEGDFTLEVKIHDSDILSGLLLPGLVNFMPANLNAEYDYQGHSLELTALFPRINYNGNILDTLRLEAESDETELNYNFGFEHFQSPPFETGMTNISGSAGGDSLSWHFINRDIGEDDSVLYSVKGVVEYREDAYYLSLDDDTLRMNANSFDIPEDNYVKFGAGNPSFNNFILTSGNQELALSTFSSSRIAEGLLLDFSEFRISNLTAMVEAGQNIFEGLINGEFRLALGEESSAFNSNLAINNLALFGKEVFNKVSLNADNRVENTIRLNADFSGRNSSMRLRGTLNQGEEETGINANLDIQTLNLEAFEPFFPEQLNRLSGRLAGELNVNNTVSDPQINGSLLFNSVVVNPTYLNVPMELENEELVFDGRILRFDNFTLKDPSGNTASLNGNINAESFRRAELDLNFTANDFQLMNTTAGQDRVIYGEVLADIDARIRGTTLNPDVDLDVTLEDDSEVFFMVPEAGSATIEREGIVEFVEMDGDSLTILTREEESDTAAVSEVGNISMNANIEIDEGLRMVIIIDPASGEQLEIFGSGTLSFAMRSSGQMTLAGRYEVNNGNYTLRLFDVIKREFQIREGSTLTWTGDVANPRLDLTTFYRVRTSPEPIIVTQMPGTAAGEGSFENLPFDVVMHIEGQLMQPELNFEITMPPEEQEALIAARLNRLNQNESELNKQVFSLLLLKSFLQESTSSDNTLAYELRSTARKGVGNLLSSQINRFADRHIEGFDISVDIDSYGPETEARTNVQANVSKQLFDERLTVRLGGSANIQQGNRGGNDALNDIAGDVEVEYKLTPQGTYRLLGFRKTEYEDVLDGELRKTGIGIIFTKDFYDFDNLFQRIKDDENNEED